MSNVKDVLSSVEHGVTSKENAATFAELDNSRAAGTLANARESDSAEATKLVMDFTEKTTDELEKMTKPALIQYMKDWHENKDAIQAQQLKHAQELATRAAIHGIPMRPRGEVIPMLLEGNPDHPGRQVPYPLLDEDGEDRMSKGTKKREPSPVTRIDN